MPLSTSRNEDAPLADVSGARLIAKRAGVQQVDVLTVGNTPSGDVPRSCG